MKKEQKLKELIRKSEPDKVTADFTAGIMKQVHAETEKETVLENLLRFQHADTAPESLTANVMSRLTVPPKPAPIISGRGWAGIAACFALVIWWVAGISEVQNTASPATLTAVAEKLNTIPLVYPLTAFAVGVLVLLDHILRNRKKLRKS